MLNSTDEAALTCLADERRFIVRILVVEDEPRLAELIRRGLVAEGFVVVHEDRDADTMLLDRGAAAPPAPEPSAS